MFVYYEASDFLHNASIKKLTSNSGKPTQMIRNDAVFQGSYPSPKQSALFLSHRQNGNVYVPSWKRICVSTTVENFEQEKQSSNEFLLDECLVEVFKRLSSGQERSACACISKRWLMLLSSIRRDEAFAFKPNLNAEEESTQRTQVKIGEIAESAGVEGEGYLARSLAGRKPQMSDLLLLPLELQTLEA